MHLKVPSRNFEEVLRGGRRFKIRPNGREFHPGDILILREHDKLKYTGREIEMRLERTIDNALDPNYIIIVLTKNE